MVTCWHLPGYTPTDRDPITHEILPGSMPPGIYCEDEASLRALMEGSYAMGQPVGIDVQGSGVINVSMGGTPVYVATPVQAKMLRAIPETPAASEPEVDPMVEISAKVKALTDLISAKEHARVQALQGQVTAPDGRVERLISDGTRRERVTPHPFRIPAGMNRAARRAAASRGKRS